jgi:hypothetical protein
MKELCYSEIDAVNGGSALATAGRIVAATAPARAVIGSFQLGYAIGTGIHNVYGDKIQKAIEYLLD